MEEKLKNKEKKEQEKEKEEKIKKKQEEMKKNRLEANIKRSKVVYDKVIKSFGMSDHSIANYETMKAKREIEQKQNEKDIDELSKE